MKWLASLAIVVMACAATGGCISPSVTAPEPGFGAEAGADPERALRMAVYSGAFTDKHIFPYQGKTCYVPENEQFIKDLNQMASTRCFMRLTPLITRRMRVGVCEKPGFCFFVRLHKVSQVKAEARFQWSFRQGDEVAAQCWRVKLERRNGEWTTSEWKIEAVI